MSGDCVSIRALLAARLDGGLPADRARAVDGHLAGCAACAELAAALRVGREALSAAPGPDLAAAVLAATTGPACPRCRAALPARREDALDGDTARLVEGHLEHCAACRAVDAVLGWLDAVLPTMAAVEPPAGFTRQVLAVTSDARRPAWSRRLAGLREGLRRIAARPLFPVEAAYVATVVAVLLFGTGLSPLREMPSRALGWLRGEESVAPLGAGAPILRDLEASGERLADEAGGRARRWRGRLFQDAERRTRAAWSGAREVGDGLAGVGHALLGHEGYELTPSLGRTGRGFDVFWGGLRGTDPAPSQERGPPPDPDGEGPADASAGGRP